MAHSQEISAAREKYINHFEIMLSHCDQLDAKLATFETASEAAGDRLTSVYDTLETHLNNIKVAKTTGSAVAILGTILCFTPAALLGAGLVTAGTCTSVGADALGGFLFEHDASEEFGSIMRTYNSASKDLADTFEGIEKTKEDMADSLAELIKLLRDLPLPSGDSQMHVPRNPGMPDLEPAQLQGPNIFSQAALRGLSLTPGGLKFLEEIFAKGGGKAVTKVVPFLGKLAPVVGIFVNVLDIANTWTNSNETLEQANKLKSEITTNTTAVRDAVKALKASLESQIGSPTVLENLRKLLRIRKSPPGRDPRPPPLTPEEVCKITKFMNSMIDTAFVVIAQLVSYKPDNDNDKEPAAQYWAEFIPKPTVLQLSESAFTAPVVDSVYDLYRQPPPKAEYKDKDEQIKRDSGRWPAPMWFINECEPVLFGGIMLQEEHMTG
ncbi:hypothetical protein K493DRAFT_365211 [Basidiobolus meristosporus CBS 931.73]|uniref:Uncharacterized protein n=1 Tax=Basidiobolus meristosporus CBS 931.73 TaxID=1314790 RepID=A0A1Y1VRA4_9FUNG|nr:hypothetical protein K493DRAFT_365211 [Basidiobolus meristosporus CBS 931.73]|eukprot:ORX63585.1 hypothetical protein K493DRAFT_365211 [Basidiobolus meristosporus CBS 931.73]